MNFLHFCALICLLASPSWQSPLDVQKITVSQSGQRLDDSLGVVYGTRPCGGDGTLIQWRLEGCNTTSSVCQYPADEKLRQCALEFIPSENIEQLGARVTLAMNGMDPHTVLDRPIEDSEVVVGIPTTIYSRGRIAKELKGRYVTVQYILYNVDSGVTQVCAEADVQLV